MVPMVHLRTSFYYIQINKIILSKQNLFSLFMSIQCSMSIANFMFEIFSKMPFFAFSGGCHFVYLLVLLPYPLETMLRCQNYALHQGCFLNTSSRRSMFFYKNSLKSCWKSWKSVYISPQKLEKLKKLDFFK